VGGAHPERAGCRTPLPAGGWWARQDSNLRATGYEPGALPLSYGPVPAILPPRRAPAALAVPRHRNGAVAEGVLPGGRPRSGHLRAVDSQPAGDENERNSARGIVNDAPVLDRAQRAEAAKKMRREEILAAARRVFAERGFRGTTIADIAEEAGIALGTIYLYFPSKEAVFGALSRRFGELIVRVFDACRENRDLVQLVVMNSDPESEVARRMRQAEEERNRPFVAGIAAAMRRGVIRAGDPAVMARLVSGVVSIAVYQAFVISGGENADAFRDACADMVVAYMTPPGRGEQG
jgi:AcrR family transcriptional regulator